MKSTDDIYMTITLPEVKRMILSSLIFFQLLTVNEFDMLVSQGLHNLIVKINKETGDVILR